MGRFGTLDESRKWSSALDESRRWFSALDESRKRFGPIDESLNRSSAILGEVRLSASRDTIKAPQEVSEQVRRGLGRLMKGMVFS